LPKWQGEYYNLLMSQERTGEIILKIAAKAIDGSLELAACFVDQKGLRKGDYLNGLSDKVSKNAALKAAKRLQEKGCLEKVEKNGITYYKITEFGRNSVEKFLFDRKTWDHKWRVVVFGIPEERKNLRERLRRTLKNSGFKQLQRSVWVSPFNVLDRVEKLVDYHDLHECMWYFLSDSIKNDEIIIERFLEKTI